MKIGILGDIHANIEALDAVLQSFQKSGVDRVLAVGDLVGYGADPSAVIHRIQSDRIVSVLGNHDAAVVGILVDLAYFNIYARSAALWTRKVLSEPELAYLRSLPLIHREPEFVVVHGSLDQPEEFNYIQTQRDAEQSLHFMEAPCRVCFVGHSHIPLGFLSNRAEPNRIEFTFASRIELAGFDRCLINVGSVGQPRDEDPRPVAAIYDTTNNVVMLQRVAYDFDRAAGKILAAGLPRVLAERLRFGV
ncbi:MAG: metallophosphoesterase family protein [Planctomycetes bacterium]|nr:metallophosphoesterase family protein [Planctomycetota bacterium]